MKRKYLILFSLSGLVICCDQWVKLWVSTHLTLGKSYPLLPFISIEHTRNNGFAFGLLQKAAPPFQEIFFIGVPVFALVLIVLIFIKLQDDQMLTSIALTTILGGAIGNLIDRIQHGFVIDYVDIDIGSWFAFPAFNIADGSIIVGVMMMFVSTLLQERARK